MREYTPERLRHLTLLAEKYPTALSAYSEIIRLEALLRLPKGTEHFMKPSSIFSTARRGSSGRKSTACWAIRPRRRSARIWQPLSTIRGRSCRN